MLPDAYITQLAAAAHASGVLNRVDSILFSPVFLSLCIMLLLLLFLFAPHPPPGALLVLDCIASGCMWVDMKVFPAQFCGFAERDFSMKCKRIQPLIKLSPRQLELTYSSLLLKKVRGFRFNFHLNQSAPSFI